MNAILLFTLLAGLSPGQGDLVYINADIRTVDDLPWMAGMEIVLIETDCFLAIAGGLAPEGVEYSVLAPAPVNLDSYRIIYSAQVRRIPPELPGELVFSTDSFSLILLDEPVSEAVVIPEIGCLRPLRIYHQRINEETPDFSGASSLIVDQIVGEVSEDTLQSVILHLQSYGTRYTTTPQYDASADWADTKMETYGISTEQQTFVYSGDSMSNVIGEIVGTENPDQIYIICGHLDSAAQSPSVAPGADDNGSGSACVIEAARVMSPYTYKNTVRFVLFAAEEQWMVGSEYYVEQAFQQGDNILGALNVDMLLHAPGAVDSAYIPYNEQSESLAALAGSLFMSYAPDVFPRLDYDPSAPSDHASFWQYGYTAIEVAEASATEIWGGYNPNYHTANDILENYLPSYPYGTDLTKAAIGVIATLADPVELSIEDQQGDPLEYFSVASNPCSGVLSILCEFPSGSAEFSIFDITGRMVAGGEVGGSGYSQVDLQDLSNGVYTLVFLHIPDLTPARFVLTR